MRLLRDANDIRALVGQLQEQGRDIRDAESPATSAWTTQMDPIGNCSQLVISRTVPVLSSDVRTYLVAL